MVDDAEASVGFWENLTWDEACAAAFGENAGDGAHGGPEAKAANRHGTVFGIDTEIGSRTDFSAGTEEFDHPDEGARGRNECVPSSGAQAVKNRPEERVFECLGNDESRRNRKGARKADPLEI